MRILLVRHDADGTAHWKEYGLDYSWETGELQEDLRAHLNTVGVSRIEIICEGS